LQLSNVKRLHIMVKFSRFALLLSFAATGAMAQTGETQQMQKEYMAPMTDMSHAMHEGVMDKDPDVAFAKGMLPHHQGAVEMAKVELKYGKDPEMRKLAEAIIQAQEAEIEQIQTWLKSRP
jgi:uncharacterized protein (DUF305 family)